jgi:tetratricopeptide (TPR) repeat protein
LLKYFNEDYSGAIADLDKAIEIDPNDAVVYYNRGITKNELKDYSGAKEDFDKALAIDPNITESLKAHLDGNNSKADAQAWLERRSTATDEQVARLQAIVRTYLAGAHFIDVNGDGKVGVEDLVWAKDASGNINVQHVDNVLADRVRVDAAVVHACYLMAKAKHEYATLEEMRVSSTYWTPTLQDGFVRVREGERASAAINDIFENPKQYRLGSNQATTIVYLKAMLDLLGPKDFDRVVPHLIMGPWSLTAFVKETVEVTGNAHQNADPEFRAEIRAGDEAYFKNLSATAEARATRGAAQHAIYLGDGKWYAHPFGITTEKGIIDYLNLSSRPGAEGLARMTRARTRMNVDILEEDKVSNWNKTHY